MFKLISLLAHLIELLFDSLKLSKNNKDLLRCSVCYKLSYNVFRAFTIFFASYSVHINIFAINRRINIIIIIITFIYLGDILQPCAVTSSVSSSTLTTSTASMTTVASVSSETLGPLSSSRSTSYRASSCRPKPARLVLFSCREKLSRSNVRLIISQLAF